METETTLIFKGNLEDFEFWLEVMKKRYKSYKDSRIEAIIEDFNSALC